MIREKQKNHRASYVVIGTTEDDYYEFWVLHQGETPEIYRDFEIYYSGNFIDILHPQKGCYLIPIIESQADEQAAIAKNFICQLAYDDPNQTTLNLFSAEETAWKF